MKLVLQGILLIPPEGCPDAIYDVMAKCWKTDPRDRIKFDVILRLLRDACTPEHRAKLDETTRSHHLIQARAADHSGGSQLSHLSHLSHISHTSHISGASGGGTSNGSGGSSNSGRTHRSHRSGGTHHSSSGRGGHHRSHRSRTTKENSPNPELASTTSGAIATTSGPSTSGGPPGPGPDKEGTQETNLDHDDYLVPKKKKSNQQ